MESTTTTTPVGDVGKPGSLRDSIATHRTELVRSLNPSTLFLTYLARHKLIEPADILKYEHYKEKEKCNTILLDHLVKREDSLDDCYSKFLDSLKRSDQDHLAALLTNIDHELHIVDAYQNVLEDNLAQIHSYLKTESRRTEVRYSTISPEYKRPPRHLTLKSPEPGASRHDMAEFLYKVHQSTKSTLVHFDRCREVIDKLHTDCEIVAKKNAEMMEKLRECETQVKLLNPERVQEVELLLQENQQAESVNTTVSKIPRPKVNASEQLMESVRQHVKYAIDDKREYIREMTECVRVMETIIQNIQSRRAILDKYTGHISKQTKTFMEESKESSNWDITKTVGILADEMQAYIQQESHLTHKHALGVIQAAGGSSHRNFDQIEHDMMHLQKEIRRRDQGRAEVLLKQIAEATKSEREDCVRMIEDIVRSIRARRVKLQEATNDNPLKKRRVSRKKMTRTVDTTIAKKLSDLTNELSLFMTLQSDQIAHYKSDILKQKLEYDKTMDLKANEIRSFEKRIKDAQMEKEKFKKMFSQLKSAREANVMTKPTIPKRTPETPDTNSHVFGHPPTDTSVQNEQNPSAVSKPKRPDETKSINSMPKSTRTRKVHQGQGQSYRPHVDNTSRRRPARDSVHNTRGPMVMKYVQAKPKLTPRAKHLTKLKATVRERQSLASKSGQTAKVQYTTITI